MAPLGGEDFSGGGGRAHARRGAPALTFSAQVTPAIPPPTTTNRLRARPRAAAISAPTPDPSPPATKGKKKTHKKTKHNAYGRGGRFPTAAPCPVRGKQRRRRSTYGAR